MNYTGRDGKIYTGATASQVVEAIRADSVMTKSETLAEYMSAASARYRDFGGKNIRTDSAENFLADLVAAGEIVKT